jgi:hypothetical protein
MDNELTHHGVLRMKWGVLRMKWGVKRSRSTLDRAATRKDRIKYADTKETSTDRRSKTLDLLTN